MRSSKHQLLAAFAVLVAISGCGEDSGQAPSLSQFGGDWVVIADATHKAPCDVGVLDETRIHELRIDQSEDRIMLLLEDLELNGSVVDGALVASGVGMLDEVIEISLSRDGSLLHGLLQIEGDCLDVRQIVARPRGADADYSGHWEFSLQVQGEGGCDHIVDYADCFRILQSGNDLLVVDDEGGNLWGKVIGNVAYIERDTPEEKTSLIFTMDVSKQELSGEAVRVFSEQACRTDLVFTGWRSETPCAEH